MYLKRVGKRGQTLIVVMLLAVILLIVILSLTSNVIRTTSLSSTSQAGQQAFSIAQSGMQDGLNYISANAYNSIPQIQTLADTPAQQCSGGNKNAQCSYIISPIYQPIDNVKVGDTLLVNLGDSSSNGISLYINLPQTSSPMKYSYTVQIVSGPKGSENLNYCLADNVPSGTAQYTTLTPLSTVAYIMILSTSNSNPATIQAYPTENTPSGATPLNCTN
jgi:Tfp pilus assembly protein PilX